MAASLAQQLAQLPDEQRQAFLATLTDEEAEALLRDWRFRARPEQLITDDEAVFIILLLCGRSWGKSDTGAHWLAERSWNHPGEYLILAPRFADARRVCVEGPSGLLNALDETPGRLAQWNRSEYIVTLTNGSKIHLAGADISSNGVRGLNLSGAWVDEVASIRPHVWDELWGEHLLPALRIGDPKVLMSTTPKPVPWLRNWVAGKNAPEGLTVRRGRSEENTAIAPAVFRRMRATMTARQARQELDAEILTDIEGALWIYETLDNHRVEREAPEGDQRTSTLIDQDPTLPILDVNGKPVRLDRVVVAIDPPASTTGDECGIVVAGLSGPATAGHCYVLADYSAGGLTPDQRTRRALEAFSTYNADAIVVEVNNGGDWLPAAIKHAARAMAKTDVKLRNVPVRSVRASRGKATRAEPIAALYEQGRVHHVGRFDRLEDQQTSWVPGETKNSPDRIDALVWAITHLTGRTDRTGYDG